MNNVEKILKLFRERDYLIGMGAGSIAKRYSVTRDDIYEARKIFYEEQDRGKEYNILTFDIETSPMQAYVWSRWKQNIYLDQTISEWFMICWAAKWFGSKEIISDSVTSEEILREDDSRIAKSLWQLMDQADIIIAHNGKRFDVPKMNTRFFMAGLPKPSPYTQIDTLLVARQEFAFSSNKLDALAGYFGIEHKSDTNFKLWKRCLVGEQDALDYMELYCRKDVKILEEVYIKLRPWIKNHPNLGLYIESDDMVCPSCGSSKLTRDNSFHYTRVSKFEIMRCNDCKSLSRMRTSSYPLNKRKKLITSV